ncbi:MAG: hypothetical protein JW720_00870 [Sedimentisphaerales bacterium]|nr:hypothetical protein [Sedimentisphaerales bacterium]
MRAYLQPAFIICVVVLALSGVVMSKFHIEQVPWPLKKSLSLLDQSNLDPYRVVAKLEISDKDTLDALGTSDYIQWVLEDTEVPPESPLHRVVLFITYYPLADRVPHVPEECYVGAGHELLASGEMEYTIGQEGGVRVIPGTHLVFQKSASNYWGTDEKFSAFYLFRVNNTYAGDRDDVRLALNKSMFATHSYFSKVEWSYSTGSNKQSFLDNTEAKKAGEKLLAVILPIVEAEHWPRDEVENENNSKEVNDSP